MSFQIQDPGHFHISLKEVPTLRARQPSLRLRWSSRPSGWELLTPLEQRAENKDKELQIKLPRGKLASNQLSAGPINPTTTPKPPNACLQTESNPEHLTSSHVESDGRSPPHGDHFHFIPYSSLSPFRA